MIKQFINKHLPTAEEIKQHKSLAFLNRFFHNQNLWHLNCYSVSTAVSIGFFVGYLPFPGHMLLAACLAIIWQANLPIAVGAVWISNPITIPPMFYLAYKLGAHLLGTEPEMFHLEANYHWFIQEFKHIVIPLMLGSLICGSTLAILGNIGVRLYYFIKKRQWI